MANTGASGLHIPAAIMRLTTQNGVTLKIDLTALGPLQRSALLKGAKTGIIDGDSVPAVIARSIRNTYNLAHAGFGGYRSERIQWTNVPKDSGWFAVMDAALVACKLDETSQSRRYYADVSEDTMVKVITDKEKTFAGYGGIIKKHGVARKKFKFDSDAELDEVLARIESGEQNSYTINYLG